ncbi:MAG: helix-turn-helix transcriptional regulator [Gemmatimonadales bacterium]
MDDARIGRTIRSLRLRRGWRQRDLAARAGVSQQLISSVERGHLGTLSLATLRRVAAVLDIRLPLRPEWRGGELDRLLDADHAELQAAASEALRSFGWLPAAEVTFSRFGERGSIDLLAFHAASRMLLVVEVKTMVADLQSLLRGVDAKTRLAVPLARERGWRPVFAVPCLILAEGTTNRRRVEHAAPLLGRFSMRGSVARAWLRRPGPAHNAPSGLLLFRNLPSTNRSGGRRAGRQRMRLRKRDSSVGQSDGGGHGATPTA